MQIIKIRYHFGDWYKITYIEDGYTHTIKEKDKTWKTFLELYSTEIAEYDNRHQTRKRISRFTAILFLAFLAFLVAAIPLSFIYDSNVTAILTHPLYLLLDALSAHFRYSALFPTFILFPIALLVIIIVITIKTTRLLVDKKKHLAKRIILPLLAIALFVVFFGFVIPGIIADYQTMYAKKEKMIVIKSDQPARRKTSGRGSGYNFTARVKDSENKSITLEFTSYQFYKIRNANNEKNGQSIQVHYLETGKYSKEVFAYEFMEE